MRPRKAPRRGCGGRQGTSLGSSLAVERQRGQDSCGRGMETEAEEGVRFLLRTADWGWGPRPGCGHAPCPLRRTGTAPDPAQADAPDVAS